MAALTLGWLPKFRKAVYVYLGYCFAISYFGGMLDIPEWISKIAILSWIPKMPIEEFDVLNFGVITLMSIILMIIGYLGYSKRDMAEGA